MSDISKDGRPASGFTLFEIAISLALVAVAVVSLAVLFPAGIRAQQLARFRLLASAKAIDLVEGFNACSTMNPTADIEGLQPWDSSTHYRAFASDLECRLASHRFGVNPLPLTIARRLDSDGDEIARLLDDGAYVYYSQPQATTSWEEGVIPQDPPSDLRKLVFAVVGAPQTNAIPDLAWKAWPYYAPYPSPPMYVHHAQPFLPSDPWPNPWFDVWGRLTRCFLWERTSDPDVQTVFASIGADGLAYGFHPYEQIPHPLAATDAAATDAAKRYVQAALWYAQHVGLRPSSYLTLAAPLTDFAPEAEPWKQAMAFRFLAHAATCLTRWRTLAELTTGEPLAPATIAGESSPAVTVTHDLIVRWHETCLNLGCRFAAEYPYDWGAPRPAERPMLMDWPLLEPDLFAPPIAGTIFGTTPAIAANAWRVIPAQPIAHAGSSMSYPAQAIDAAWWGDATRFTLAAPFAAAERCRELVFWAVDWQSYEDYETAASAPIDASKYPRMAPNRVGARFDDLLAPDHGGAEPSGLPWLDMHVYNFRNPEKVLLFTRDETRTPTGADVRRDLVLNQTDYNHAPDRDPSVFCGLYGADRDFDKRLGRGPLPRTARLRATTVARFAAYDPRLPFTFR